MYALHAVRCFYQPTYDVAVVDTTGAGDSFMGALVYSLTRKETDIEPAQCRTGNTDS